MHLFGYVVPTSSPEARNNRGGTPWWDVLQQHGVEVFLRIEQRDFFRRRERLVAGMALQQCVHLVQSLFDLVEPVLDSAQAHLDELEAVFDPFEADLDGDRFGLEVKLKIRNDVQIPREATFHVGGLSRRDPKRRLVLRSGDVFVLGGAARMCFHGIDRIHPGTSALVAEGGRFNLTMRRVTRPN